MRKMMRKMMRLGRIKMRRFLKFTIGIVAVLTFSMSLCEHSFGFKDLSSHTKKVAVVSQRELKRYFEKAMYLFESARYRECISVFENLIELEKSQGESYFTPFAEIYIEKATSRMLEMLVLEDKKWAKMKKNVIDEAEAIAVEEADRILEEENKRLAQEKIEKRLLKEARKKEAYEVAKEAGLIYAEGIRYYREGNYPSAIVEFKKIEEIDPSSKLVSKAETFIEKARREIKEKEERGLLVRMEAAKSARLEIERDEKRRQLETRRMEREKIRLKEIFKRRLSARIIKERIDKIEGFLHKIRGYVRQGEFQEAQSVLDEAIREFPENERFKDILHYVEMQKIKREEIALKREREIIEERMLLEIAKKHRLPEEKVGVLKKEKKIIPLVRVPKIRKRLEIPISVDFQEVELDYVLNFLSEATGVNIVPSSAIDMEEKKVTIKIRNIPLEEALTYILKSQDLVHRVEEDAVWVTTREELDDEDVDTRVYFLNQGVGRFAELSGTYSEGGGSVSTEVKTVKDILENAVDWPKDSRLTMDERTGALIISNIPSNLEIVENLIYNLDMTPIQVLIEAKFLEVQVTDVDELGFEWKFNSSWGFTQNNAKQDIHGLASNSGADFSNFSRQDEGFNLTYQGILSHPQFQMVIHALKEKQNVKTLSAPRITTLNNQTATIEVIEEYIYPTRYEVSLVQYDINGDGDFDDAGETEWANIPQDFVTRDVGILLHVKPSVGIDNKTITLALTPEVSESSASYTYSGDVSIPQFQTRNLSTSVIVGSGETVVLGGLIKETNTNIETKVPLLGDIPFFGRLFKKNTESVERKNLLIFVTAKVLNREENLIVNLPENEL